MGYWVDNDKECQQSRSQQEQPLSLREAVHSLLPKTGEQRTVRANKLQLNLLKTKEIVFRCPTVHLDIMPVKLCDIERLDCVKLLGVFIDSKLLFSEHVERLLGVCNQRLYLLSQLRKQGLSDECVAVVYNAIVLSKVLYALSEWGGYISQAFKDRIDASFRKACRWKLTRKHQYTLMDVLSEVDSKLFDKCKSEGHCLHQCCRQVILWLCVLAIMNMMSLESLTTYEATKRSLMMRCLYRQKTVDLYFGSVVV